MIFIILGTERYPFDRMIKSVDRLIEDGVIREEVFFQLGSCKYEPRHAKFARFLSFGEMYENISRSSLVLAHAGAGTTLLCLQVGRPVILFPRLCKFKEHVDDHQVPFAEKMKETGRTLVAYDYDQLKVAVQQIGQMPSQTHATLRKNLVAFLHGFLKKTELVNICGVDIHNISLEQAIGAISEIIRIRRPSTVFTPNVDHVVKFQKNAEFRRAYEDASLVLADGVPLLWASRFLGEPIREKISGSDLFPKLCEVAAQKGWRLFFLGGRLGAAVSAQKNLLQRYPMLNVVGTYSPPFGFEKDADENARIVEMIRAAKPDILFIGLGAPKQEKWAWRYKEACGAPVTIGIGVSFEFSAGMVKRAPRWMQKVGLEWSWRLMMEPVRLWRRYLVDDMEFFGLVLAQKRKKAKAI